MAEPQRENGHVDIANTIVEALARIRISGNEWQCLCVVFRKTYGWHKKEDMISLSQFALMTGLKRPNVVRVLKKLISKKILFVIKSDTSNSNKYRFNKDFDQWRPVIKKDGGGIKSDNRVVSKVIHTKENIQKKYSPNSDEIRMSELLFSLIRERDTEYKKPDFQKWALHINKMVRLDNRKVDDIEAVITWCQADTFWQNNVLSTSKLRVKFGQLKLKMEGDKSDERKFL